MGFVVLYSSSSPLCYRRDGHSPAGPGACGSFSCPYHSSPLAAARALTRRSTLPTTMKRVVWCLKAKAANAGHAALISSTTLHTACDVCLCVATLFIKKSHTHTHSSATGRQGRGRQNERADMPHPP